ncbi:MAG: hypothetical protein CM1200mP2_31450 [Planctomycetaceae bacterium]|nr:MAG: hypothetical protein CM1200mP2_31450 [Planctomycetaceae bacterium]
MTRYNRLPLSGQAPDVAFALNRPRVPFRVAMKGDYYLGEFPVTNGMYPSLSKTPTTGSHREDLSTSFGSTRAVLRGT